MAASTRVWTDPAVDLVADDDDLPLVLELELLDPALFLDTHPAAASRFAHVLRQLIP